MKIRESVATLAPKALVNSVKRVIVEYSDDIHTGIGQQLPDIRFEVDEITPSVLDPGNEEILMITIIPEDLSGSGLYDSPLKEQFWGAVADGIKNLLEEHSESSDFISVLEASFYMNSSWHYIISRCR